MRRPAVADEEAELLSAIDAAVCGAFRDLRRTIQKNLALLTVAEFTQVYPDVLAGFNIPSGGAPRGGRWVTGLRAPP